MEAPSGRLCLASLSLDLLMCVRTHTSIASPTASSPPYASAGAWLPPDQSRPFRPFLKAQSRARLRSYLCIISLTIRCTSFATPPSRIPASLHSLVINPYPFIDGNSCASPCVMSHFTNVPGLTSLAVFLPEQCPHLIEILTNSQSSLTSLEILNGQFISKLATLHFPRLVAFHASNTSGKAGVYLHLAPR